VIINSRFAALGICIAAAVLTAAASRPALKFDTPAGWVSKPPTSSTRVAEFTLPHASGDSEDGALAIYFFGGTGGSVQANLDRWTSQMTQPDGKPSADAAKTTKLTANGMNVTLIDVSGTYVAEVSPGSSEHYNKPNFRLRAAVVETPGGPHYIKLTGPAATIARWDASFTAWLKTLRWE